MRRCGLLQHPWRGLRHVHSISSSGTSSGEPAFGWCGQYDDSSRYAPAPPIASQAPA